MAADPPSLPGAPTLETLAGPGLSPGTRRFGAIGSLCLIVVLAIVCIVVAGMTSAHRADEVAIANERGLVERALKNQGHWAMVRLTNVVNSEHAIRSDQINAEPELSMSRITRWLSPLLDHDFVLVFDGDDRIVFTQPGSHRIADPVALAAAMPDLIAVVKYLRGEAVRPPAKVIDFDLGANGQDSEHGAVRSMTALLSLTARLSVVSVEMLGTPHGPPPTIMASVPVVMTVRHIDDDHIATIGERLQLENLRLVGSNTVDRDDHLLTLHDINGAPLARLAWIPSRPGAEVFRSVVPFIVISLGGFAVLVGFMMRLLRRTEAAMAGSEMRLRHLAMHDPLSGLPNRIFFSDRLQSIIAKVKRGGPPAAVFYIDLDHFKDVNDTHGHPVGDELIRKVTSRLRGVVDDDDLVARLGGDEFALITTAPAAQLTPEATANKIIAAICAPYSIGGSTIVIGASIGIALIERGFTGGAADVLRFADMALYRAKNEGRNRPCLYDKVMDADLSQRKLIEQELREAIENDALEVHYQPVVNAAGNRIVGVEALARWTHPLRGPIAPSEFIPIAEHSGLIVQLGASVLRRACLDGLSWPELTVSVNVSPLQFRQAEFAGTVESILSETGFDPARLELEVTESTLLGNVDAAEAAMQRIKALGVKLALDDFGTGYSSLMYLRRLPFDRLKIDRSFVQAIEHAPDATAIVHAIVSLGRGLGMAVTAEGVETAEQHLFLRAAAVHCMQGFRFGSAVPAVEINSLTSGCGHPIAGDALAS